MALLVIVPAGEGIFGHIGHFGQGGEAAVLDGLGLEDLVVLAVPEADHPGGLNAHGLAVQGVVGVGQAAVGPDGDHQALVHAGGAAGLRAGVFRVRGAAGGEVGEVQLHRIPFGVDGDHGARELGGIVPVVKVGVVVAPEHDDVVILVQDLDELLGMGHIAAFRTAGGGVGHVPCVQREVGQEEDGDILGRGLQIGGQLGDILLRVVVLEGLGDLTAAEAVDNVVLGADRLAHLQQPGGGGVVGVLVVVVAAGIGEPFMVAVGVDGVAHLALGDLAVHVIHDLSGIGPELLRGGDVGGAHVAAEAHGIEIAEVGLGGFQPGLQVQILAVIVDVGGEGQVDGPVLILHSVLYDGFRLGEVGLGGLLGLFGLGGLRRGGHGDLGGGQTHALRLHGHVVVARVFEAQGKGAVHGVNARILQGVQALAAVHVARDGVVGVLIGGHAEGPVAAVEINGLSGLSLGGIGLQVTGGSVIRFICIGQDIVAVSGLHGIGSGNVAVLGQGIHQPGAVLGVAVPDVGQVAVAAGADGGLPVKFRILHGLEGLDAGHAVLIGHGVHQDGRAALAGHDPVAHLDGQVHVIVVQAGVVAILCGDQNIPGDGLVEAEGNLEAILVGVPAGEFIALHRGRLYGLGGLPVFHELGIQGLIIAVAAPETDEPGALQVDLLAIDGVVNEIQGTVGLDGDHQALVDGGGGAGLGTGVLDVGGCAGGGIGEVDGLRIAVGVDPDLVSGELGLIVVVVKVGVVVAPEEYDIGMLVQHIDDLDRVIQQALVAAAAPVMEGVMGQDENGLVGGGGLQPFGKDRDLRIQHLHVAAGAHGRLACAEAVDDVGVGLHAFAHHHEPIHVGIGGIIELMAEIAAGGGEPFVVAGGVDGGADLARFQLAVHIVEDDVDHRPVLLRGGGIGGAHVAAEAHGVDIAVVRLRGLQPGLQVQVRSVVMDVGGEGQGDGAVAVLHGVPTHGLGHGNIRQSDHPLGLGGFAPAEDQNGRRICLIALTEGGAVEGQVILGLMEGDGLGLGVIHHGAAAGVGHEAAGAGIDEVAGIGSALHRVAGGGDPDGAFRRVGDLPVFCGDLLSAEAAFRLGQGEILPFGFRNDDVLPAVLQLGVRLEGAFCGARREGSAHERNRQDQRQQKGQDFSASFHTSSPLHKILINFPKRPPPLSAGNFTIGSAREEKRR